MALLKILRIVFTVLAAILLTCAVLFGTFLGGGWAILCLVGALLFFGLMLLCKNAIEKKEEESKPKQPTFFDPYPNGEPQKEREKANEKASENKEESAEQ